VAGPSHVCVACSSRPSERWHGRCTLGIGSNHCKEERSMYWGGGIIGLILLILLILLLTGNL
jgi:hypothetical protein